VTEFEAVWGLAWITLGSAAGAALLVAIINAIWFMLTGRFIDDS
jgi:hypothetical protein